MILIYKYQRPNMDKGTCQAHFFKNGKYIRSSDIHPYSDNMIEFLTKGHSKFALVNVMSKADLSYQEFTKVKA